MKKHILIAMLLLPICSHAQNVHVSKAQNQQINNSGQDMQVMQAAKSQLAYYLSKIPAGQEEAYGFTRQDERGACIVGKPYRVMTFSDDFFNGKDDAAKDYLEVQGEWRVPVTLMGENRILLTVDEIDGKYNVVGIGGAGLAKELGQLSKNINTTHDFYLLRVYSLTADFFVHATGHLHEAEYMPMASAVRAMPALKNVQKASFKIGEVKQMVKTRLIKTPVKK